MNNERVVSEKTINCLKEWLDIESLFCALLDVDVEMYTDDEAKFYLILMIEHPGFIIHKIYFNVTFVVFNIEMNIKIRGYDESRIGYPWNVAIVYGRAYWFLLFADE